MNANELADELERLYQQDIIDGVAFEIGKAAAMLRQQQAEIETYKLELYDEVMLRREQQAEIEALRMMLANKNDALDKLDLK